MAGRRVVFCTYPSLYSSLVLERLLHSEQIDVVGVVLSTRVGRRGQGAVMGAASMLGRTGLRYALYLFCVTGLFDVVGPWTRLKPVARLASAHAIPQLKSDDINDSPGLDFLRSLRPDVLLCAHFNQRVGATARAIPALASLNIHPSPLPRYRGVDPVFHALWRGERRLGVTLHRLDEAFDTGPILDQQTITAEPGGSVLLHTARLFVIGAELAVRAIAGPAVLAPGRPQPDGGEYDSWPGAGAVEAFRRRGGRLLDAAAWRAVLKSSSLEGA